MKLSNKYECKVDPITFLPYIEVCGKKVIVESIIVNPNFMDKEQVLDIIREDYGDDVYKELKELKEFVLKE